MAVEANLRGDEPAEMTKVAKEDEWIVNLDLAGFGREMRELGDKLRQQQGVADEVHLDKILRWHYAFCIAGFLTMYWQPNLFTVVCLSTGLYSRWVMIGHHVCHGGYDNTPAKKRGFSRWVFGVGSLLRRAIDWFDWMLPEAWNIEHGRFHHYSLNEDMDPDLVQMNAQWIRGLEIPVIFKYLTAAFFAITWKWTYYSSNTYSQLLFTNKLKEMNSLSDQMKELAENKAAKANLLDEFKKRHVMTVFHMIDGNYPSWWSTSAYMQKVFLPFFFYRFVLSPLPFLLLGKTAFFNAVINLILADMLCNCHSFLTVVPNHAGDDLYWFDDHCEPKSDEFFLRQVIGSTDCSAGTDPIDFFHGFLNYQIEHHLWPDLSMLSYQKAHPLVKDICKKYNVPFVQHTAFYRLHKTLEIFVGSKDMKLFPSHLLKRTPARAK
uniref:Omega3 desaturase n=1 Tax=Parietichytrium sp. TaxID=1689869 RepID=A0A809VMF7_9STRA|nr:omega3 desaturase [Parietichytrium sp.]